MSRVLERGVLHSEFNASLVMVTWEPPVNK